jgi:hypothetical protein
MSSGVCQAQTRIQSKVWCTQIQAHYLLRFKNNLYSDPIKSVVYSDSSTMSTQIGAQGCNQTRIQAQCVLGLDQQGIQIKASNCD